MTTIMVWILLSVNLAGDAQIIERFPSRDACIFTQDTVRDMLPKSRCIPAKLVVSQL